MLTGANIVLRFYRSGDAESIHRWKQDPETTRWMGRRFRDPSNLDATGASLEAVIRGERRDAVFFAIADRATGDYRGGIDLTDVDLIDRNAVLSLVVDPEHRGRGIAGEAVALLLAHAFGTMKLHKVSLNVYEANQPAVRCYQRAGFRPEGRIRDHAFLDGRYHDLLAMGILETEWSPRTSKAKSPTSEAKL
jgi:RimJ/RimL family protein N-acetyltransferase